MHHLLSPFAPGLQSQKNNNHFVHMIGAYFMKMENLVKEELMQGTYDIFSTI